jgi:hypothetical protein
MAFLPPTTSIIGEDEHYYLTTINDAAQPTDHATAWLPKTVMVPEMIRKWEEYKLGFVWQLVDENYNTEDQGKGCYFGWMWGNLVMITEDTECFDATAAVVLGRYPNAVGVRLYKSFI